MRDKLATVLGSLRFWQALFGGVVYYLQSAGTLTPEVGQAILGFLGVSLVVRSVDKFRK